MTLAAGMGGELNRGHASGSGRVAILLSTFNGERWLEEQLRGYLTQTHADWRLYWRDDGSSDRGEALVRDFARVAGPGRCLRHEEAAHLGAAGSFLALLRMALGDDAAYFAFSDQDDVWLPRKLAHGVAALNTVPAGQPALYFCNRVLVDAALRPLGPAPAPRRPLGFPAALTQNVIPGCCMILNRAAAALIDANTAPEGTWHDWWAYIVVSAAGGAIIGEDSADILYRQHTTNLVGEPRDFWRRVFGVMQRGRGPFMGQFWRHVEALRAHPAVLSRHASGLLRVIEKARGGGPWTRLRALFLPGFVRQRRMETFLFRLWFLLG